MDTLSVVVHVPLYLQQMQQERGIFALFDSLLVCLGLQSIIMSFTRLLHLLKKCLHHIN